MKHNLFLLAVLLLVARVAAASDASAYSLDVDVSSTGQPGVYMFRAILTDLDSGNIVFAPSIQLKAGTPATASGQDGALVSEFLVSVDPKSSRVTTEVKVTRAGKLVAAQKSSVALR